MVLEIWPLKVGLHISDFELGIYPTWGLCLWETQSGVDSCWNVTNN